MNPFFSFWWTVLKGALKPTKDLASAITFWGITTVAAVVAFVAPQLAPSVADWKVHYALIPFFIAVPVALMKSVYTEVQKLQTTIAAPAATQNPPPVATSNSPTWRASLSA